MTSDNSGKGVGINAVDPSDANVSEDFQLKQIDRLVEAIALTLPNGGVNQGALGLQSL